MLFFAAWLGLEAVKILDLNVYHNMLRGAVAFGEDFEEHYMKQIFDLEKGMTQAISHFSRHDKAAYTTSNGANGSKYTGGSPLTTENKIRTFYMKARIVILIGVAILFAVTNLADGKERERSASAGNTAKIETKIE